MKQISVILATILFATYAQAITCTGTFETVNEEDQLVTQKADLTVDVEDAAFIRLNTDIGDYHFSVQGDKASNKYLMMITIGPVYMSGVTAAMTWDQDNSMRITRVDGTNVYKLACQK